MIMQDVFQAARIVTDWPCDRDYKRHRFDYEFPEEARISSQSDVHATSLSRSDDFLISPWRNAWAVPAALSSGNDGTCEANDADMLTSQVSCFLSLSFSTSSED